MRRFATLLVSFLNAAALAAAEEITVLADKSEEAPFDIEFTGTWFAGDASRPGNPACNTGAVYQVTETPGDSFTFLFTGTSVRVNSLVDTDRGTVEFDLDGTKTTQDTNSQTRMCKVVFSANNLDGTQPHTLIGTFVGNSTSAGPISKSFAMTLDSIVYSTDDETGGPSDTSSTAPTSTTAPPPSSTAPSTSSGVLSSTRVPSSSPSAPSSSPSPSPSPTQPSAGLPSAVISRPGLLIGGLILAVGYVLI